MLSSSNLVTLATLWMSAVSGVDGHWGSRPTGTMVMRSSRRGSGYTSMDDPMAELVRDFFSLPTYAPMRPDGPLFVEERRSPQFDVSEEENGTVHLTMEVPGLSARDLTVEVENDHVLRVEGIRTRRQHGRLSEEKFKHAIRLKDTVDPERMEANLSSGILTITVPQKPTKIKKLPLTTDERSMLDAPTKDKEEIKSPEIF